MYSFTGLKNARNNSENESNQYAGQQINSISDQQKDNFHQTAFKQKTNIPQKERINRKMTEKILPQNQKEKSEHRKPSQFKSQPREKYKTFIQQSKTMKKVEFQK